MGKAITTRAKPGAKSKYREEFNEQARKLTLLGMTIPKLAKFFEVGQTTIDNWMREHPKFGQAIRDAREPADGEIANAMYQNAVGYEWEEEQAYKVKVSQYEERIEIVKVRRKQPPNVVAGIFLLSNRHPELWKRAPDPNAGDDRDPPKSVPVTTVDASVPEPT